MISIETLSCKRAKDTKWMTAGLRISTNKKATLYRKYIKSPTLANKEAHRKYKTLYTNCNRKAADMYYRENSDTQKQNV